MDENSAKSEGREVVLCHFGGPTKEDEVVPFLKRLFNDPCIINAPALVRKFISALIIFRRAPASKREYKAIGYSPANRIAFEQARLLEALLREKDPEINVHLANRYCEPFSDDVVPRVDFDHNKVFLLGLFPHYSASTIGSAFWDFSEAMKRNQLSSNRLKRIKSWWNNKSYLDYFEKLIIDSLKEALEQHKEDGVTVLFSAHGIPEKQVTRGDPYVSEIKVNFAEMDKRIEKWLEEYCDGAFKNRCTVRLSFQSRSTPVKWIEPYTDKVIKQFGSCGGALLMIPISFVSDHIETLYEMDETYKKLAMASGYSGYFRMRMPNEDPEFARCLHDILLENGF